ncbi:MAG: hypothetical protein AB7O32_04895 [Vicinamibacterales bacterium]
MSRVQLTVARVIRAPRAPNFVQTEDGHPIDVAELSQDEVEAIAHAMRVALLENVQRRRQRR